MSASRAASFRALHHGSAPLVLPNAWDAASARLVEAAGAAAIATTSSGVSWAHGRPDGHGLSREAMVAAVRRIVEAVDLPVTADVEGGYGDGRPDDVAATVRAVVEAGAVGVNLEDSPGRDGAPLLDAERLAERIGAAREAAGDALFLNARIDVFLAVVGDPGTRLEATLERARRAVDAGADGVFVPGVADAETIRALAASLDTPLNVMAGPSTPPVEALAALGVARVSAGPHLALAAYAALQTAAADLLATGTVEASGLAFADLDGLFRA